MWIVCLAYDSHDISRLIFSEKKKYKIKYKQEDHDGPISLTWPNRFAYLLLKFQPSSLL